MALYDCRKCPGYCCSYPIVTVTQRDLERLAKHLGLSEAECEKRHGKAIDLAVKSTYNPKSKNYFAFSDSFVPDPINYRTDLWSEVGKKPDTWDDIRAGGKLIKEKTRIPVGIGRRIVWASRRPADPRNTAGDATIPLARSTP